MFLSLFLMMFLDIQVQRMDSDSWKERCDAQKAVEEMVMNNEECASRLRTIAKKHSSYEVKHRCKRIMNQYYNSAFPKGGVEKMPCLDMIPDREERQMACKKYLQSAEDYGSRGSYPEYEPMRLAAQYYIIDRMHAGMSKTEAKKLIKDMLSEEEKWLKDNPSHGYDYGSFQKREDR